MPQALPSGCGFLSLKVVTPGLRLIDIEVIGGTVVLSGKVATFHQKQLASALAGKVAGVVEVMNRLEVTDGGNDGNVRQPIGLYRQRAQDGDAQPRSDLKPARGD